MLTSPRLAQSVSSSFLMIATAASSLFSQSPPRPAAAGNTPSMARNSPSYSGRVKGGRADPINGDLLGASASLDVFGPGILAVDAYGNLYIAVRDGVFKLDPSGFRVRVAGTPRDWQYSGDDGLAIHAGLNPRSVAIDAAGNLYLADTSNNRIRKLAVTGIITTVAGDGIRGSSGDNGPAISARLDGPTGVAVDRQGNLYIVEGTVDGNNRIRKVAATTGVITTVAGNGTQGYSGDGGPAVLAQFSSLGGLATDPSGDVYIADNFNHCIRKVSAANGIITTVAGNGVAGLSGDGGWATNAELNNPLSVAVDSAGNLFIVDSGNYRVRKVSVRTGMIATVGNGDAVYRDALHGFPCAVAVDAGGNLYVADSGISGIRKVSADIVNRPFNEADGRSLSHPQTLPASGFKINVT